MNIKKLNEELETVIKHTTNEGYNNSYIVIYTDGIKDTNFLLDDNNELYYDKEYIGDIMDPEDDQEVGEAIMDYAQLELNKEIEEIKDNKGNIII